MKTVGFDITVLNDVRRTGIAVYNYHLLENLLKINKTDRFILFGISTFETFDFLKDLPFKSYPNVEMKIFKMSARALRIAFLLWQRFGWPSIERFTGPLDIFHSFNFYLPPQRNGKIVTTVFDMTPKLYPQYHLQKTIQLETIRMNRIKEKADLVITISENSKKDFSRFDPYKKIEVVYPGVSNLFFERPNETKIKKVLYKYGLEKGYILSVGTLEPRKNIDFLVKAYLKSRLDRRLVLVGMNGWKNSDLFKLVNRNQDKIRILGFIPEEDLLCIYSQAFCLVYPSLYEGFGMPILEGLASGIPVISSRNSSLEEAGGDAVYYINPNNEHSLINALMRIMNDEGLRNNMKSRGLNHIRNFTWKKSAQKLNAIYKKL